MKRAMIIIYHTIYPVFYRDEDDYLASSSRIVFGTGYPDLSSGQVMTIENLKINR